MVVLRPGDRVLVTLTDEPDPELIQQIAVSLRQGFPGVEFTVLTGVSFDRRLEREVTDGTCTLQSLVQRDR